MIFYGNTIAPGEKRIVQLPVTEGLSLEAICICGAFPGRTLAVTAGVHGCEYVGIQALLELAKELDPGRMCGNAVLLPLVNPEGFYDGVKQVVPEDGINLNRAFPGDPGGSISLQMAYILEQALYPAADLLADLHGGDWNEDLCPLVFFPAGNCGEVYQASLEAAKQLKVSYRVRSHARNGLYSWAVQRGIPALLAERGCGGRWSEKEKEDCMEDVRRLLRHLSILPGENEPAVQTEICRAVYAEAKEDGLWYPCIKAAETVKKGQFLGELRSMSGQTLQEVRAAFAGVVLYYTTALGVRRGGPLAAYGESCAMGENVVQLEII